MAVDNIKHITQTIITLLELGFKAHYNPNTFPLPDLLFKILPDPPAKEKDNGICFYLFHMQESAQHKNFPPAGIDSSPVKFSAMGLNLYYQLTANFEQDTYDEQETMGIAMKILHDYPEINDKTNIRNTSILPLHLQKKDNRVKISLLPINYNESVHFWTAGQSPMKLSAYYEVSMIFLEPEPPTMYAGRVLQYGAFIFTEGVPRITSSRSTIVFTLPNELIPRQVVAQPAQVAPGSNVEFLGSGFSGDDVKLILFNSRIPQIINISNTTPNWGLTISGDNQITITVQDAADGSPILPGLYSAQVNVTRRRTLPNGQVREFINTSNQFPFTITPHIENVTEPTNNIVSISGINIGHTGIPSEEVLVFIGEDRYSKADTLIAGTFKTDTSDSNSMQIMLKSNLVPGVYPIRILISGAESAPHWITIP